MDSFYLSIKLFDPSQYPVLKSQYIAWNYFLIFLNKTMNSVLPVINFKTIQYCKMCAPLYEIHLKLFSKYLRKYIRKNLSIQISPLLVSNNIHWVLSKIRKALHQYLPLLLVLMNFCIITLTLIVYHFFCFFNYPTYPAIVVSKVDCKLIDYNMSVDITKNFIVISAYLTH